jgi:hypothetical protein
MPWQHWRTIDPQVTHSSDDATYIKKLPQSNFLHTLLVLVEMDNGATNNQGLGMSDAVDWIKVIGGGSQVLAYLEPETIRGLHLFETGKMFEETHDEQGGNTQYAAYPIHFGRGWYDQNYYLPLRSFNDLEVQIKYSPTIAATSFATGTFKTTILGLMTLDGNPGTYEGTFVTRILQNFTTAASGDETIEPPQRHPWRFLGVRCYEAGIADGVDITNVQFDLNDEQRIPLNLSWNELHKLNYSLKPVDALKTGILDRTDADTVATQLSRIQQATLDVEESETYAQVTNIAGDTLTLEVNDQATQAVDEGGAATYSIHAADTADHALRYALRGKGLPFMTYIPLFNRDEPPYFDPTRWDQVKLSLTQGAAGGDVDVILQEVQRL